MELDRIEFFCFVFCCCYRTVCGVCRDFKSQIREKVGDGRVLLALSGGVDSSVCAALLSRAVGKKLTCIFVDHGFLRKNEGDEVEAAWTGRRPRRSRAAGCRSGRWRAG